MHWYVTAQAGTHCVVVHVVYSSAQHALCFRLSKPHVQVPMVALCARVCMCEGAWKDKDVAAAFRMLDTTPTSATDRKLFFLRLSSALLLW